MTNTIQITQNLTRILRDIIDADYPRPGAWVTVMDVNFMKYPMLILEDCSTETQAPSVIFNVIAPSQAYMTAERRNYEPRWSETVGMFVDVDTTQRRVSAFYSREGGWERQEVNQNLIIEFGSWIAEVALDDIYEDVVFPADEVAA